ncbi:MAG TPA: M48 family metalloprotease [Thermoanaerobaculia bacterium]|nr:M48 family metalloprotease [Thermoanaerobaculia bacterium]
MKNQLKTVVLLGSLSAIIVGLGALVAPGSLALFGALALAVNLGAYFFSDRIVLRMHHAREAGADEAPELHAIVEELSARAGIPRPRVFLIPEEQPNAFATGRNPERGVVAVTEGLVRLLDRRELRGVIAHELAHIKNRDILVSSLAAAAASLVTYVAQAVSFGAFFGGSEEEESEGGAAGGLLAAVVAPLAATLIQFGISRAREFMADETGARISGEPEALARALVKLEQASHLVPADAAPATASLFIVNPFGAVESLSRWFSTHPRTEERVERLLAMAGRAPLDAGSPLLPRLLPEW